MKSFYKVGASVYGGLLPSRVTHLEGEQTTGAYDGDEMRSFMDIVGLKISRYFQLWNFCGWQEDFYGQLDCSIPQYPRQHERS